MWKARVLRSSGSLLESTVTKNVAGAGPPPLLATSHRRQVGPSSSSSIIFVRFKNQAAEHFKRQQTSLTRALEHYDDFYASVYGKKWPSLRLALLSPPKYIAIPNTYVDKIVDQTATMEKMGAYDIKALWSKYRNLIAEQQRKIKLTSNNQSLAGTEGQSESSAIDIESGQGEGGQFREAEEVNRLEEMDKMLVSYARTKVAEELDVLYQNAPERKLSVRATEGVTDDRRVLKDIREASQEFVTPTKLKGMEDFELESEYFSSYGNEEEDEIGFKSSIYKFTNKTNSTTIEFPPFLRPFCFEGGNASTFPPARKDSGLRDYLCVNGASLAPIIALDMKLDTKVLDLCAGPGTKSLLMLMTMCPSLLVCNDLESSRLSRIKRIFEEFLGGSEPQHVQYTKFSGAKYPINPIYNRVLADVPCTSDRISLTVADNNIFKPQRAKERLGIVKVQKNILMTGFQSLLQEPGSVCVYSTCTMSPIENDGVVAAALKDTDVPNLAIDLMGLWNALLPLQAARLFQLSRTKFGVLVEPNIVSNFGPMYVSRIVVSTPTNSIIPPPQ